LLADREAEIAGIRISGIKQGQGEAKRPTTMLEWLRNLINRPERKLAPHLELGERGEQLALDYLKNRAGYRIVATNFSLRLGRNLRGRPLTGEIDIIAYDGPVLVFVEVKTRASDEIALPQAAIDLRKQRQIARTAQRYRQLMQVTGEQYRFDAVSIILGQSAEPRISLQRAYFTAERFRKRAFAWTRD